MITLVPESLVDSALD
uniref:Uncharacterized protein n=1 Tax=Anguilla anguilla TaxID=7936 RepID=A0A0E9W3S9_ANGAN